MLASLPSHAAQVQNVSCPALNQCALGFNLNSGEKMSGSISISGGLNNDIGFYITNPTGAQIYNAGRVSGGTAFSISADTAGAYTLHFDNSFAPSEKLVTVSYDVSSSIQAIPEFPVQLGLILLVTAVIVASYAVARRDIPFRISFQLQQWTRKEREELPRSGISV
jgi:hypothetical protein